MGSFAWVKNIQIWFEKNGKLRCFKYGAMFLFSPIKRSALPWNSVAYPNDEDAKIVGSPKNFI